MSFTLTTLKTAVKDYLQVDETTFNNNLDRFIQESESRIFKLVRLPEQRQNVTGNLTASVRFLATPSDFCTILPGCYFQQCLPLSGLQASKLYQTVCPEHGHHGEAAVLQSF